MVELSIYMNTRKIAVILTVLAGFSLAFVAKAADDNSRYLVKSNASIWKKSFNVRHVFDGSFTADLNDWQLRLTKIFGIEIEPVKKLNVLDNVLAKTNTTRLTPDENIPWGVKSVYGDPLIKETSGGKGVVVAILDTGIAKHPDVKIKECKDFSSSKSLVDGKCEDKSGHGTHVAGIIAANGGNDSLGIQGVAPEASLYVYKVCANDGSCWADDVAAAIRLAADSEVNIINMGIGSDIKSDLISDAVDYAIEKGVLIVAAAGNDGPYVGSIDYPASNLKVVSVGAVDFNNLIPDWSARGSNSKTKSYIREDGDLELVAPGVNIESTTKDGGYAILSGSSMAAAHISGLAAKLWQKDEDKPADATREILHQISQDILPLGDDANSGWGLPKINN